MRSMLKLFDPVVRPTIVTSGDLCRYVVLVTLVALALALSVDVANQLMFFTTWAIAVRSWVLTVMDVLVTGIPISLMIGRAQRDLYHAKRRLEHVSRTDVLTGLPNRRALMECVEAVTQPVMVLVIADIDRFKSVNDTYGHRTGDTVIRVIAQMMASALSDYGTVGRLGGEEFALIAPASAAEPVLAALEAFRCRVAAVPIEVDGREIAASISAGASIQLAGEPFDLVYAEADAALYRAKASGRNRIELSLKLKDRLPVHRQAQSRAAA